MRPPRIIERLLYGEDGAQLVEYALVIVAIVIVAIAGVSLVGEATTANVEAVHPGLSR